MRWVRASRCNSRGRSTACRSGSGPIAVARREGRPKVIAVVVVHRVAAGTGMAAASLAVAAVDAAGRGEASRAVELGRGCG